MDNDRIVFKGDISKWEITILHKDFDQLRDNYRVELDYGMFKQKKVIQKNEMYVDEDGNTYMMFDSADMTGLVKAYCFYDVPDSDFGSGIRQEVDIQWLCFVVDDPKPRFACDTDVFGGDGHVEYKRVYRGDVKTLYMQLRTNQQEPLRDSEGNQLRVKKVLDDLY